MQSQSKVFLNVMKCPVCMEYMMPPIRMCVNGHNICDDCRPKFDDCPTCSKRFLSTTNEALEVLAYEMQYPFSTSSSDVTKCSAVGRLVHTKPTVGTVN